MEALLGLLQEEAPTVQAVAVTIGGLIGVFATLGAFFLFIFIAEKIGRKKGS